MSNYILSRNEVHLCQLEATWSIIPNSSGVATLAGSNACRITELKMDGVPELLRRNDKTGNRSLPPGVTGMVTNAPWSARMDLAANGAGGIVPDMNPYLQSLFGQAPTIVASTSVNYTLSDTIPSLNIWSFRTDASGSVTNVSQRVAVGAVVSKATVTFGAGKIAYITFEGTAKLILYSNCFATSQSDNATGLTAFPAQPGSLVTNGYPTTDFFGSITMDSNVIGNIQSGTLTLETGNKLSSIFGSRYRGKPIGALRNMGIAWKLYDQSDSNTLDLYNLIQSKNPFDVALVMGNVAGNTWNWSLNNVQADSFSYDDSSDQYIADFNNSPATSTSGLNEASLLIN